MIVGFVSPFDVSATGIATYSRELAPALATALRQRSGELEVFASDTGLAAGASTPIRPLSDLQQRASALDAVLYQIGNSPAHAAIYERAFETPGIVVLHEYVLVHLRIWMAIAAGTHRALLQEAADLYGAEAKDALTQAIGGQFSAALLRYPLSEALLARSKGVIVHSAHAAKRVADIRPGLPVTVAPMAIPLMTLPGGDDGRTRFGMSQDAFVIGAFGHINPYKRISKVLSTVARLRDEGVNAHLLLVGSRSANYAVTADIESYRLHPHVTVTGHVDDERLRLCVAACDVCVSLRHPTGGETSASALRLMGAGRAVLVSTGGSFDELPSNAVARVDVGPQEEELLFEYLRALSADRRLRDALGAAARAYVAEHHSLERAVGGYLSAIDASR